MMRKLILMFTLLIIALYSCEKDDHSVNNLKSDYIPMAVGNYWVYEIYDSNTLGEVRKSSDVDSVVIVGDTLVNECILYKFEYYQYHPERQWSNLLRIEYLKDSCKYLVDIQGRKLFSENNFSDTIVHYNAIHNGDTLFTSSYKMETLDNDIRIPAGTFNDVLNFKGTHYFNPNLTDVENPRYSKRLFAKDVGLILDSIIYSRGPSRTKKLVRYELVGDK